MELVQFFRGERPWSQLLRLLDGLPPSSRYVIAKRNDPVVALEVARADRDRRATGQGRYRPPAVGWDTHADLLARVVDRLGEVAALLADMPIRGKQRKAKPPPPVPRPLTAIEKAEHQLSQEHALEIMADVEASYVTEEEYARIAAEVEAARMAEAEGAQAGNLGPDLSGA